MTESKVPIGRFYTVISVVAVIIGLLCYHLGSENAEVKHLKDIINQQEVRNEIKTKHLVNKPDSDNARLKWLQQQLR